MSDGNSDRRDQLVKILAPAVLGFITCAFALIFYGGLQAKERDRAANTKREVSIAKCVKLDSFVLDAACADKALNVIYEDSTDAYDLKAQQEMAKWALLMLIVTSVGVYYVILTLQAATEANERFSLSTDRQLRPYVLPAGLEVADNGFGGLNVMFVWTNHGHTPTVNAITTHFVLVSPSLPDADFEYRNDIDERAARIAVGPGATTKSIGPSISSADVLRMRSNSAHVLVWGFVEYSDRNQGGKRFRTEYCARIVEGRTFGFQWSFIQHGPFNGWDSECLYPPQTS